MTLVSGIIVFLITWWIVFLMTLPVGAKTDPHPETGHDTGAPTSTYLRAKLLITTLISIALWLLVNHLITINLIDFRTLGRAL